MTEPRVKAGFWVSMALRLADRDGRPGAVLRKGDPDAGGEVAWMRGTGVAPVDQETADAYIARQVKSDPDLWVVEFESPDYLPPFDAKIL